jgi:deoxyribonuclease V
MILPCEQLDPQGRSPEELKKIQLDTASQVSLTDSFEPLKNIAGADCSYIQDKVIAVIIVQDAHTFEILEQKHIIQPVKMPYVSTYLSFREGYPLCCAFHDLRTKPDLMLVDGCGISHPRGAGIAAHLGVVLDIPTIGISKKILCGKALEPIYEGEANPLVYHDEQIGWALKSTRNSKPIIVTPGHRISLGSTLSITKRFLRGHKLPEPIRLAHNHAYSIRLEL